MDTTRALPARARISPALSGWLVALGASTTSRAAASVLHDRTGLVVAPDTIRAHTTRAGSQIAGAEDALAAG